MVGDRGAERYVRQTKTTKKKKKPPTTPPFKERKEMRVGKSCNDRRGSERAPRVRIGKKVNRGKTPRRGGKSLKEKLGKRSGGN